MGCLWAIQVLFVQGLLFVVRGCQLALDEDVAHVGGDVERVAVGDDEIGGFAGFHRAKLRVEPKHLCGIERDRLEPLFIRQAVRHGVGCILAETPREAVVKAAEGDFDAGRAQLFRLRQQAVVGVIFLEGFGESWFQDDGDAF